MNPALSRPGHRKSPDSLDVSGGGAPAVVYRIPLLLALLLSGALFIAIKELQPAFRAARRPSRLIGPPGPAALPAPAHNLAPYLTPEVRRWLPAIATWSQDYDLPASLIATVLQIESCGDPAAQSPAGALGLFQVMPYHFEPGQDPLQADTNARAGLSYLRGAYDLADSDPILALAGYNGGHGVIARDPIHWADETRRYVQWGSGLLADINAQQGASPTLEAWLAAGGRHLCRQAAARALPPELGIVASGPF